jgi:ABC-type phosphate transport system permease subunit
MLGEPLDQTFATATVLLVIIFLLNGLAGLIARLFKKG